MADGEVRFRTHNTPNTSSSLAILGCLIWVFLMELEKSERNRISYAPIDLHIHFVKLNEIVF